jgi:hypothetical protein
VIPLIDLLKTRKPARYFFAVPGLRETIEMQHGFYLDQDQLRFSVFDKIQKMIKPNTQLKIYCTEILYLIATITESVTRERKGGP